jgi:putative PEP-CTERM system histidine kinase
MLTGFMLIGPELTHEPYTSEDLDFLATVGQQAAGVITTARLTETLARAREFEAFHRFTSFVIHDLKNSISALSLLSQNAAQHFDDPEFQRDATRTLGRTVDRMKRLLGKLSSAPETTTARSERLDLVAIVRDAVGPLAGNERVRLVQDLLPVPSVAGDPEAVLQVVQNLVTNAVEALDGHGTVTVRTYAEDAHAVVEVGDTGCGIPEKFLRESLFAPFRSTKKGGWGVGLYQARSVAEAHGGQITVVSKEGEGTTFWLKLPWEREKERR